MGKNPPANEEDMGSIPGLGRSHMPRSYQAHVPQLLSLCPGAHTPQLLMPKCPRARALQPEKPSQREACAAQLEESPHSKEDPAQPRKEESPADVEQPGEEGVCRGGPGPGEAGPLGTPARCPEGTQPV